MTYILPKLNIHTRTIHIVLELHVWHQNYMNNPRSKMSICNKGTMSRLSFCSTRNYLGVIETKLNGKPRESWSRVSY